MSNKNGIGKLELAKLLMDSWYLGESGDWAKKLAEDIHMEAFDKIIAYQNKFKKPFHKIKSDNFHKIKQDGEYE